ncbi:MAG: AAA family ATPase [Halanaerobiales bacterium]|nr:AAA family ATPase [Halanaerobiales bacterium]
MFKNISIKGFRGITTVEINDFRRINVFVGKNNCGKTTILEGMYLLSNPTNPKAFLRINAFRGLESVTEDSYIMLCNKLNIDSNVEFSGDLKGNIGKRSLSIKPNMKELITYIDATEKDMIHLEKDDEPYIEGLSFEYSYSEGNSASKEIITTITPEDSGVRIKREDDISYKESLKSVFIHSRYVSKDITERFNNVQIRKKMNKIIKVLRQIEPSLIDLSLGVGAVIYCDIGMKRLVPINVMGDGILRLLNIILTISDAQNGVVFIDEIENGLYPSSQEVLWNAIFETVKEFNVQIFATTHSIECIRALNSSYSKQIEEDDEIRLYRVEKRKDILNVVDYDSEILGASLDSGWEVR